MQTEEHKIHHSPHLQHLPPTVSAERSAGLLLCLRSGCHAVSGFSHVVIAIECFLASGSSFCSRLVVLRSLLTCRCGCVLFSVCFSPPPQTVWFDLHQRLTDTDGTASAVSKQTPVGSVCLTHSTSRLCSGKPPLLVAAPR